MSLFRDNDLIDFGDVPDDVNDILQDGVSLYRHDKAAAEARFYEALDRDPSALATYFCLYKILAYDGRCDEALNVARAALAEAARQASLPAHWRLWTRAAFANRSNGPARFALYTLKALAFIHLRSGNTADSDQYLGKLRELGEMDGIGGSVVADLARAVA